MSTKERDGRSSTSEHRRVEIIHESLLSQWPRLVRWQTQDQEGAQLRDQLRQAAQLWEQRERSEDLLWTGTAFREYELWRERYPGGLTESEESFAEAMIRKAHRQRRRRRLAVSLFVVALLVVLAVVTASRQQAIEAREDAEESARRAEAQKLLALGQLELDASPTLALAHATKSLELADTPEARRFVLRALAAGPPATILPIDNAEHLSFSPDGDWAAFGGGSSLRAVSRDGARSALIESFEMNNPVASAFDPSGRYLFTGNGQELGIWSIPDFELVEKQEVPLNAIIMAPTPSELSALSVKRRDAATIGAVLTAHEIGAQPREIGRLGLPCPRPCRFDFSFDRSGRWIAYPQGDDLYVRSVEDWSRPPRRVGTHPALEHIRFDPAGARIATNDGIDSGIRIWSLTAVDSAPQRVLEAPDFTGFEFDPSGDRLAVFGNQTERPWVYVWDLEGPQEASPLSFPASPVDAAGNSVQFISGIRFTPDGRWLATTHYRSVGFWPLDRLQPRVIAVDRWGGGSDDLVGDLEFTPDGKHLISGNANGALRIWPLEAARGSSRTLLRNRIGGIFALDVGPDGRFLVTDHFSQTLPVGVSIVPLDGGSVRTFVGFAADSNPSGVAVDPEGRLAAVGAWRGQRGDPLIKVWDIETGAVRDLGRREAPGQSLGGVSDVHFLPDGSLLSNGGDGLSVWSLDDGSQSIVAPSVPGSWVEVFDEGRRVAHIVETERGRALAVTDLVEETTETFPEHGDRVLDPAVDLAGRFLVSADADGVIRVGPMSGNPVTGREPHLLLGHRGRVEVVRVSPDGRWIASAGQDRTIRLWPVPDLSKPPLHALPHDELIAKLHTLTNVRLVEDPESPTGWKPELGPFPGWEEVPEW